MSQSRRTRAIHEGELRLLGSVTTPIFPATTYKYNGEDYHDVGYMRLSNTPNHRVLGQRLASLEGTEAALVTGSGMSAISSVMLSELAPGDHVLVQDVLYGGTLSLIENVLKKFGVSFSRIDPQRQESWTVAKNTKAIYVEAITNPRVDIADHRAVIAFAGQHGLTSIIDNTYASPVNFRPAELGYDIVIESCTKYLNGHTDVIAGCVASTAARLRRIKETLDHVGGSLDTHACYLLERGLKTLDVRVRAQNESAERIARWLEERDGVASVRHPSLKSHPQHARAQELFDGFGGMLSFELEGGRAAADRMLERVRVFSHAASFGGPESLMVSPSATHSVGDEVGSSLARSALIRVSIGLEDADDLIADLDEALS
ncbi:MAG: PLP-dependent transferase [Myxococcota bacterium]